MKDVRNSLEVKDIIYKNKIQCIILFFERIYEIKGILNNNINAINLYLSKK